MHRFFHTIVIVGAGVTSSCGESHEDVNPDAGGEDASQDAQSLADRVIEDAETMLEDAARVQDASQDSGEANCYGSPSEWDRDACPLIR